VVRAPAARDVLLERMAGVVEAMAEQLVGEVAVGPVAVDLVAVRAVFRSCDA
jgi:hypothetical protein